MVNKLLHGDCLELMKKIPNRSIDMILCDLRAAQRNAVDELYLEMGK